MNRLIWPSFLTCKQPASSSDNYKRRVMSQRGRILQEFYMKNTYVKLISFYLRSNEYLISIIVI